MMDRIMQSDVRPTWGAFPYTHGPITTTGMAITLDAEPNRCTYTEVCGGKVYRCNAAASRPHVSHSLERYRDAIASEVQDNAKILRESMGNPRGD